MGKRLLSMLIAVLMVVSMVPTQALAAEFGIPNGVISAPLNTDPEIPTGDDEAPADNPVENPENPEEPTEPSEPSEGNEEINVIEETGITVAKIGDVSYETLQAAINAAEAGNIIEVLVAEIELPTIKKAGLIFKTTTGTKITNEISSTNSDSGWSIAGTTFDGFEFTQRIGLVGKDITIKNCKFTGSNGIYYGVASGTWTIENCEFNCATYGLQFGSDVKGTVNVKNTTFYGGFNTFGTEVNFDGCIFNKGANYNVVQTTSNMTLKNCTIAEDWPTGAQGGTFGSVAAGAVTEIYNTTYKGEGSILDLSEDKAVGVMVVDPTKDENGKYTGGTFAAEPAAELLADSFKPVKNADGSYEVKYGSSIAQAIINNRTVDPNWVTIYSEAIICGNESMEVKLYSEEELLATTKLVDTDKVLLDGKINTVTWHLFLEGSDDWWKTEWVSTPIAGKVPTKVELWVDGAFVAENNVYLSNSNDNMGAGTVLYDWSEIPGVMVAKVGNDYFGSIKEAIGMASKEAIVELLGDVKENKIEVGQFKDVVIDLAGYTVTGDFMVYGNATIKNGTIDSTVSGKSGIEVNNEADRTLNPTLVTENLTIKSGRHAIRVDGGTVTINSGSYTAADAASNHAVNISDGGKVTIKDGTFIGNMQNGTGAVAMRDDSSELTIENGTFKNGSTGSLTVWGGTAKVIGGTFETVYADRVVAIEGGNFATINKLMGNGVTGGTFGTDPSNYVAENYKAVKQDNGTYAVVFNPSGDMTPAIVNNHDPKINTEWVTLYSDATICGKESMVVKLYSGEKLLGTTTLVDTEKVLLNGTKKTVTYHFFLEGQDDWWKTELAEEILLANEVPTKVELWVDDVKVSENVVNMENTNDNLAGAEVYYNWGDLEGVMIAKDANGSYYDTLQEAIDNATTEITLLGNTKVEAEDSKPETHAWVKEGKTVVIDLNNCTVDGAFFINGTATIKNGYIVNTDVVSGIETKGNLTLENMTITSNRHALRVAGGTVLIKSGIYTTTANGTSGYAMNVNSSSKTVVTIEGGEFYGCKTSGVTGKSAVTVQNGNCSIIVKDGKFVSGATEGTAYSVENYSPNTVITGGEFHGSLVNGYNNISGGKFTVDPSKQVANGYVAEKDGEFYKVVEAVIQNVTTGKFYATLQSAINAANSDEKITILADVSEKGTEVEANSGEFFVQILNKEVTIDLGGHTFNGSFYLNSGAKLTIDNGYIVSLEGNKASCIESVGGSIVLGENLSAHSSVRHTIRVKGGTAVINGGTYKADGNSTYHVVNISHASNVTINGGTFTSNKGNSSSGNAVMIQDAASEVTINGGTFQNAAGVEGCVSAAAGLTIYGGNFDTWSYDNYLADGYMANKETDGTYTVIKAVATVNGYVYETLTDAIAAAKAGETVTLVADVKLVETLTIAEDKNITLDLNGKAITVTKSGDRSLYAFNNEGTLTLTDSVGTGSITARGNYNYGTMVMNGGTVIACDTNGGYGIWNYGNFTMNGGTIKVTHVGNYNDQYGPTGLGNMSGATAKITGGNFEGNSMRAYIIASEGTLEITPAEGKTVTVTAPRALAVDAGNTVINGGTFTAQDVGFYYAYFALYVSDGKVTVNDGTFNAVNYAVKVGDDKNNPVSGSATINGGTFNADLEAIATEEGGISVSGGTFAKPVAPEYCAEGFVPTTNEDGTYGVVEGFDFYGTNMTLGNALDINFAIHKNNISKEEADANAYYAVITRSYSDGKPDVSETIWSEYWAYQGNVHVISYKNLAAKEMNDVIKVQIFYADGTPASKILVDSIRDYAMRMLDKDTTTAKQKTFYVDMLNYGAAAQVQFKYAESDFANSKLTEAQKALATESVTMTNNSVKGDNYYASSLILESRISLLVAFENINSADLANMKAVISFTDHYGNQKTAEVAGEKFGYVNKGKYSVEITDIVVADVRQMVTVIVYNQDGTVHGTVTESVESYLARMANKGVLYENVMKFSVSAYNLFH